MRITFDLSPAVHHHAGLGRYAHELLAALCDSDRANEYRAFYYAPKGNEHPDPPLHLMPDSKIRLSAKPWRMSVLLAYFAHMSMDLWLPRGELFHATDHLLPRLSSASVFTLHDLIFRCYPEHHLPLNRWYLSLMLPRFLQRANEIITVSENTRRDAARLYGIPEERMTVVYEGVSAAFHPIQDAEVLANVHRKYNLPSRFLLYLGTIEPRKNLLTLLEAYQVLCSRSASVPDLVIAGRRGWLYEPVLTRVRELGLTERVRFTGWVAEADTPALLNAGEAFVFPSFYEGFGLPPLEAMACGIPVISSNASSLTEVTGEAAILVEPRDVGGWVAAMERALEDESLRARLRMEGIFQASKFSWDRAARETLGLYERAAARKPALK